MCSMINIGYWNRFGLLGRRFCDHVVMSRMMIIGGRPMTRLKMIMPLGVRRRFRQWIADVYWDRLAGTVISAVPHPAGQLHH